MTLRQELELLRTVVQLVREVHFLNPGISFESNLHPLEARIAELSVELK